MSEGSSWNGWCIFGAPQVGAIGPSESNCALKVSTYKFRRNCRASFFVGDEVNKDDSSKHATDPAIVCETCDNSCGECRKFCRSFVEV